ncbi:hypothetical protein ACFST9_04150 [Hymenobacter monticola]|uniref:DUF4297 domain-containing protein n=1 Tax=Hymenobacter monticola TaxID=1705399 RepID=A0ABY4B155_9BACT|nr:hypothetical protein [Hymenobacter monticola]UOE32854.1 hypothetical protein MTP16_17170 [Hymenobacter monticola]
MSALVKTRSDITAADDKVIGFEYQFYYFLLSLLDINEGESVGLEVKDDVHIDKPNGVTVLFQLKHTIDPDASKLTELDDSLWKTLYNWALVIDEAGDTAAQFDFCYKNTFTIVTNMAVGARNAFLADLEKLKREEKSVEDLRLVIEGLHSKTTSDTIKSYLATVLSLDNKVLKVFLKKLEIEDSFDDIHNKIIARLHKMMVNPGKIETILRIIDGGLRRQSYDFVKNRQKMIMTYEEFHRRYQIFFDMGRTDDLIVEDYECDIENPLEQTFIKQLIDLGDISVVDDENIIEYTGFKLTVFNNLINWLQNGLIAEIHVEKFNKDAERRWKNAFTAAHRFYKPEEPGLFDEITIPVEMVKLASLCLDEVRKINLAVKGQQLDIEWSNGQFYLLSDQHKIGWLIDWHERYGAAK